MSSAASIISAQQSDTITVKEPLIIVLDAESGRKLIYSENFNVFDLFFVNSLLIRGASLSSQPPLNGHVFRLLRQTILLLLRIIWQVYGKQKNSKKFWEIWAHLIKILHKLNSIYSKYTTVHALKIF